jgi:hypothetical protein
MRWSYISRIVLVAVAITLTVACSSDNIQSTGGTLQVFLTDAPIDMTGVSAVNVTFTGMTLYAQGDMTPEEDEGGMAMQIDSQVMLEGGTINLLDYQGGEVILVGSLDIPAGDYKRIRLHVSEAELVRDDDGDPDTPELVEPVFVPSSKIDILFEFNIADGEEVDVILDFDAAESVHLNQTGGGQYILRPVVNHISTTIR